MKLLPILLILVGNCALASDYEFTKPNCAMSSKLPNNSGVQFNDANVVVTWSTRYRTDNHSSIAVWENDAINMSSCLTRWFTKSDHEAAAIQTFISEVQLRLVTIVNNEQINDDRLRDYATGSNPVRNPDYQYRCSLSLPKGIPTERYQYNEWGKCVTDWANPIYRLGIARDKEIRRIIESGNQRIMQVNH